MSSSPSVWILDSSEFQFTWDLDCDRGALFLKGKSNKQIWQGSLLPCFWLKTSRGNECVKAVIDLEKSKLESKGGSLHLILGSFGKGQLQILACETGIRFLNLKIIWEKEIPAIIGLYFGTAPLTEEQSCAAPNLDLPFWPNWLSEGYCIPSAKGAPIQSFFRRWDLGHATIPLGHFGPSLGTPYAAAYPRPVFSTALGGENGWMVTGPGEVPDGALSFEIKSGSGCLHYLYREDLWGPLKENTRIWKEPLRLSWSKEAWDAFHELFKTFGSSEPVDPRHQVSLWNSWGEFKEGVFDIPSLADRTLNDYEANLLCIDGLWESDDGSGEANPVRFPHFEKDLEIVKGKGLKLGFWQSVGWIHHVEKIGLTSEDLICGVDGKPRRVNWLMCPFEAPTSHLCLDPSSARTKTFLKERTQRLMRKYQPQLLKLDFAYGLANPNVGVPRDPNLRGERFGQTLLQIIADAAREIDPKVTIQYSGIHPLMRSVSNLIALDDLGDAGSHEALGHRQWSVWSALAGAQGIAIMASSGYDWSVDSEILLNTAVIGSPGSVLPKLLKNGKSVPDRWKCRRQALSRWYRRSTGWSPLWLNTSKGSIAVEPTMNSWGRLENIKGKQQLTALVLREELSHLVNRSEIRNIDWSGDWALISQDDNSIYDCQTLACIPFDAKSLTLPFTSIKKIAVVYKDSEKILDSVKDKNGFVELLTKEVDSENFLGFLIFRS
jgi:hypothetical protein